MVYFYKELRLSFLLSKRSMSLAQKGFTLIEMALVLMVLGLFIGAVISFADFDDNQRALRETEYRQKKIAIAISDFANRHGYVPCASKISGAAMLGHEQDYNSSSRACEDAAYGTVGHIYSPYFANGKSVGILPYKTLGLPKEYAYDGYGRLMTYVVYHPAYRSQPGGLAHASYYSNMGQLSINSNCRMDESNLAVPAEQRWIYGGTNINPQKARFCCQRHYHQGNPMGDRLYIHDITIPSSNGDISGLYPMDLLPVQGATLGVTVSDPGTHSPNNDAPYTAGGRADAVLGYHAYMLVSHGENASGAMILNQSGHTVSTTLIPSNSVWWSLADSLIHWQFPIILNYQFLQHRVLAPGYQHYDNIAIWRTQEQIISETGITDCTKP